MFIKHFEKFPKNSLNFFRLVPIVLKFGLSESNIAFVVPNL